MKRKIIYSVMLIFIMAVFLGQGIKILDSITISENIRIDEEFNENILEDKPNKEESTREDVEKINNISLLATGDIMFHIPQIKSAQIPGGSYDFSPVFKHVKSYIQEADIAVANLETVTAGKEIGYSGFPRFNSPKETITALKETGFDILATANNHSLDQGKQGIISTLKTIKENNLKSIGTYDSPQVEHLIEDVKGIRLGLLSYTYGVNGLDSLLSREEYSYMINIIEEERIKKDINELKDRNVDLVVIYIHWGHEYHNIPSDYQMDLGHKIVEWGGDIILGSHPHVIQKSEIIEKDGKDKFIIYSMGNFLSNQRESSMGNPYTEDGVMVKIDIEKNMKNGETIIKDIDYIPTWIHRPIEGNNTKFEILPIMDVLDGKIDIDLPHNILSRIKKSYDDTMRTLNQI